MSREEDLLRIAKKLDKMVSRNNMDGALDLLRELKNFNMTLKLLQDTRIGMSVNGIRKHCTDEDVVNLAKILIKNWKKLLESADKNQKSERTNEVKNGDHPSKASGSPNRTSPERESRRDTHELLFPLHNHSHPPLPPPPIPIPIPKRSSEVKKERRDPSETLPPPAPILSLPPPPPPPKHPSLEEPRERAKKAIDPNGPLPPLPFHLHPPQKREMKKERKETADPSAPLPPVPLHLQPTPTKRPALDTNKDKEKERKDTSDPKRRMSEHNEKDRKDTRDSKPLKRPSMKLKIERKDSTDSKKLPPRKPSMEGRRDSKDSTDSKSSHHLLKRQLSETKLERRDSTNSRSGNSPQAKKSSERQELYFTVFYYLLI
ncbi:transcription elongation factor A protein 3 isoform X10 [Rhinichthys klamathensis goyatoka]|uniref:transcription elongation factor A protein 3 isoform X10 n=1 Tax=Rhinichthys klamathensis goyatoka TaxID=3034132 RepID=UPI0024B5E48F|nr:transcription elongation factor A protein 3 isoform X10 [Rhinichthys klamathensis goyatoka]